MWLPQTSQLVVYLAFHAVAPSSMAFTAASASLRARQTFEQASSIQSRATALRIASTISLDFPGEPVKNNNKVDTPKVGVLLLNLGGPETGDDVEGKPTRQDIETLKSTVGINSHSLIFELFAL